MNEQIDIAVDLGAVRAGLPEIVTLRQFWAMPPVAPLILVENLLHQGCKMILAGTSKSNKSWFLLDLAIAVASGQKWAGHACTAAPVLYINFELQPWAMNQRLAALANARPEYGDAADRLHLWNLRGLNADFAILRPQLEDQISRHQFGLIILDPAYKLLGDRDENANGEIAGLMNEFEALARSSGAAVVIAHHFAKGDSTIKEAADRMSGAGAWARDPDSILVLTPHEEDGAFTCTCILRNLPPHPEFVLTWDFPLMRLAQDLNPDALRRPQAKNKVCTDKEFMDKCLTTEPQKKAAICENSAKLGMSRQTTERYLKRLVENGVIAWKYGLYWRNS